MDRYSLEDLLMEAKKTSRAVRVVLIEDSEQALALVLRLARAGIIRILNDGDVIGAMNGGSLRYLPDRAMLVTAETRDGPQRLAVLLWSYAHSATLVERPK